ncbi:hypothetical protein [Cryptosporangium arvum]|uniref:hypothetical protein n=1 Tax=Cryptosporangium arvum TaxID=80871 RepID=UPI0004B5CA84|nr:hypothetical protein [Cryptosporangium arvum]
MARPQHLAPTARPRPARIGDAQVRRIVALAGELYDLDYDVGGDTLWDRAETRVREAHQLLRFGTYSGQVGPRLHSAVGELGMCAGWLAFDAGRHPQARRSYTEALTLARIADDPWLEFHALVSMSMQGVATDRPRDALALAQAAEHLLLRRPHPLLAAVAAMRQARAYAKLGDPAGMRAAMDRAWTAFEARGDTAGSAPEWTRFLDDAELAGNEGMCENDLGRLARASALLDRACGQQRDGMTRNLSLYTVRLARVRLAAGDAEGAVRLGETALGLAADRVASTRIVTELRELRDELSARAVETTRLDALVA